MRTRTTTLAGLLAGALLLAACGGGTDTTASSDAAEVDFNDADVAFVSGMKPHHEQAVEMSEIVLDADPTAEVAALAEQIRDAQEPEIEQLDEMLDTFGVDGGEGYGGGHSTGMDMSGGGHGGMMSDGQMQMLDDVADDAVSRMFLEMMIEHHEGAVQASDTELDEGEYEPALALADSIRQSQTEEIDEMKQLLRSL